VFSPVWGVDLVHSIPCPAAFDSATPHNVGHWPPHGMTCQRNCAIFRMPFAFQQLTAAEAHAEGSKDPASRSRDVFRVPSLKYHLLCHPDHAEGEASGGAGLTEHSGVCPAGGGKDRRSSSSTVRAQQQSKRSRMRKTTCIADKPPCKGGTSTLLSPPGSW